MNKCLSANELRALLESDITDNRSVMWDAHLTNCERCQARLEELCDAEFTIAKDPQESSVQQTNHWDPNRADRLTEALQNANREIKNSPSVATLTNSELPEITGYDVSHVLGRGGMGIVLKARHQRMKREVAIKILPATSLKDSSSVERFYREVEVIARLSHPNIVAAYDAGEQENVHYLVMELVNGKDLSEVLHHLGPYSVADAVACIHQAATGLEYAHERGIIHRDIKPANLLLDRNGVVKILDLGLARLGGDSLNNADDSSGQQLTQSGQIMGTVDFMAPEQALDTRQADHRADIYSLGCTLYRLLMGESLFGGDTLMKRILAHQTVEPPRLTGKRSDVPETVDAVFQKMVAKQPEDRQQSMSEVLSDLRQACKVEPSLGDHHLDALVDRLNTHGNQDGRARPITPGNAKTA